MRVWRNWPRLYVIVHVWKLICVHGSPYQAYHHVYSNTHIWMAVGFFLLSSHHHYICARVIAKWPFIPSQNVSKSGAFVEIRTTHMQRIAHMWAFLLGEVHMKEMHEHIRNSKNSLSRSQWIAQVKLCQVMWSWQRHEKYTQINWLKIILQLKVAQWESTKEIRLPIYCFHKFNFDFASTVLMILWFSILYHVNPFSFYWMFKISLCKIIENYLHNLLDFFDWISIWMIMAMEMLIINLA